MADIGKGWDFIPGEQVTDVKLDSLAEASIILPAFVTGKTELLAPAGTEFFNVVDSTGTYKKVALSNIPGASTQPNPVYTIITPAAGFVDQTCAANKVYQNAKVVLNSNLTLRINGATNGMFGVILAFQDATGGRTLALPANSVVLGQSGFIALADISLQPNIPTACSWTTDGVWFYWTFAKFTVGSPYCRAYLLSPLSLAHNTIVPAISYTAENFDNDTMHDPTAGVNSKINIQRPGIYMATLYHTFATSSAGSRWGAITINGTPIGEQRHPGVSFGEISFAATYPCNKGDYFQASVFQDSGGALNLTQSVFTVTRVGAF